MATGTGITSIKNEYVNADGLVVRWTPKAWPSNVVRPTPEEATKYAILELDLKVVGNTLTGYPVDSNNDGTTDSFSEADFCFPAGSSVLRVIGVVTEASAGGTSFVVGTYKKDGTIISANSLITATEATQGNTDTVGKRIYGAGALLATTAGTAGVGTNDAYVALFCTGTFTAGKLRVFIEYLDGANTVPTGA